MKSRMVLLMALVLSVFSDNPAPADPCGMVPPIYLNQEIPIARVGLQKTYVFFKDGVESFVIRPGFTGKVDEFGMLIPFPNPPAIRKMPDDIFAHLDKAIDPPEVVVNLFPPPPQAALASAAPDPQSAPHKSPLQFDQVRVLRQEAVGMYEVAVLEAGSSAALNRWMSDHGYKYPRGMDEVCDDYVKLKWCFVAVKTKVGQKRGVAPRPGAGRINSKLPKGSTFDGNVQAMGFRFHSKQLVVPMRLSAFNEGELRNVVYLVTDGPRKIRSIPEEYVVRQLSGEELHRNVSGLLPLRVLGGTVADIPKSRRASLLRQRDPAPHNGHAKDLFASDLLAVKQNRLSNPHEEAEKMLLRIGERFGLRGAEVDRLNGDSLKSARQRAVAAAVKDIKNVTLTVIDGDFPREVLGGQNLRFAEYRMPPRRNSALNYDATRHGPARRRQGIRHEGALSFHDVSPKARRDSSRLSLRKTTWAVSTALVLILLGLIVTRRRNK